MESMSVASECGCKDIDFLILLIPIPLVSALFGSIIPTFCSLCKKGFVLVYFLHNFQIINYCRSFG